MAKKKLSMGGLNTEQGWNYIWSLAEKASADAMNAKTTEMYHVTRGGLIALYDVALELGPRDLAVAIFKLIEQVNNSR